MTKEKIASLNRYLTKHQDLLKNPPTERQATPQYKAWLEKEISAVKSKLDAAKLEGSDKK